jgi:hypothetical protein
MNINEIISNVKVYGLEDSVRASKYPMATDVESCTEDITDRVRSLGRSEVGSGHDNYLNGIIVQFDLTFTIKAWTEAERYHFFDFVSSQSTMHRIPRFDPDKQCNEYVTDNTKAEVKRLLDEYNANKTDENYLRLLYNVPTGFRLTAKMTTNYRQLKTMYYQRKNHRLPEWKAFCDWILSLPYFEEICLRKEDEKNVQVNK